MILKNLIVLFVTSILSFSTFSQENQVNTAQIPEDSVYYRYLLVNSAKPTKKIKLKEVSAYTITYVEKFADSNLLNKVYFCNGNIRELKEGYIEFDVSNETIEQNFKDGSVINSSNDYSSFYYSENEKPRMIDLSKLVAIDYSSPKRNLIHTIGRGTLIVSASIALIAAPVISIAYNKKTADHNAYFSINNKAYFNFIKTGLVGSIIGYPMARFTRTKRYYLTDDKSKKDKKAWYLEKQL